MTRNLIRNSIYSLYLFPFIVFFGLLWYFPFGLVDDAFIPMVYAGNLAQGFGVVFHPQFEPVEGYTSPVWMFGLTIGELLGLSLPTLSLIVCVLFGLLGIILTMRVYQLCFGGKETSPFWSILVGIALVADWSYVAWSSAGLETSLFSATLLLIVLSLIKQWKVSYIFCLLLFLSLVRPEGPAYSLPVFIILWQQRGLHKRTIMQYTLFFLIPFLLFIIWRCLYFGYPLPNSFYAKHDFGGLVLLHRGIEYIRTFFAPRPILLFIVFIFILNPKETYQKSLVLFWILLTHILLVIVEGGDHFALHRFLMPALPFIYIYMVWSIESLLNRYVATRLQQSIAIHTVIFVLFCSVITTNTIQVYEYDDRDPYRFSNGVRWHFTEVSWVDGWKKIGLWLKEKYPPDTKIAVITAGAIPYYSQLPAIDIIGINNEAIAHTDVIDPERKAVGHEKSNPEFVLEQNPEWLQLFPMLFFSSIPIGEQRLESMLTYPAQIELWNHNGFHEKFKYTIEETPYGIIGYFEQRSQNGE